MSTPPSMTGATGTGSALSKLLIRPDYAAKSRRKRPRRRRVPPRFPQRGY